MHKPSARAHAQKYVIGYLISTTTVIRERASILRSTYIVYLAFFFFWRRGTVIKMAAPEKNYELKKSRFFIENYFIWFNNLKPIDC
jgi:hypothetical protein